MCFAFQKRFFLPFCPWHDKSYVIDNPDFDFSVEKFHNHSMAWLEVSDAVFLVPGWEGSKVGVPKEIKRAKEIDIPIFNNLKDLLAWGNE